MGAGDWRSSELLAWTERDGPGRPPRGPAAVLTCTIAVALGVAHVGMLFSDALCPDHRAWVLGLGAAAVVAAGFAIAGLVQGSAASAPLTVLAALCGVAIGAIDVAHDPSRGRLIAVTFGVLALAGALLTLSHLRLRHWERRTAAALRPVPVPQRAPARRTPTSTATDVPAEGEPGDRGTDAPGATLRER